MRHRWGDVRSRRKEPDELVPELPAECERVGLERFDRRNRLPKRRDLPRRCVLERLRDRRRPLRGQCGQPEQCMPDVPPGHERVRVERRVGWDGLRQWPGLRGRSVRNAVRHRRDGVRVGRGERDQRVSNLPAGREHDGVEQCREWNELRGWAGLQRSQLRLWVLHRHGAVRIGRCERDQRVPDLSAQREHGEMEHRRRRDELHRPSANRTRGHVLGGKLRAGDAELRTRGPRSDELRGEQRELLHEPGGDRRDVRPDVHE